jgi:hypothetical protein
VVLRAPACLLALSLIVPPRLAGAQDPAAPDPAAAPEAEAEAEAVAGPIVHFSLLRRDPTRGVVKLARHVSSSAAIVGPNAVLVTTRYDELCSEPCGVPVDVSERPVFFFIRDGQPITSGFRLNDLGDELTLRVKPQKTGLLVAGVTLAVFLIGIPMWIAATPKVWASPGRPGGNLSFRRLKKAR